MENPLGHQLSDSDCPDQVLYTEYDYWSFGRTVPTLLFKLIYPAKRGAARPHTAIVAYLLRSSSHVTVSLDLSGSANHPF